MTVAELVKKSRRSIQLWVSAFNEGGLEAIEPKVSPRHPSRLSENQKKELKVDMLMHPRGLGYEFSNWEGKSVANHIEKKFDVNLSVHQVQIILRELGFSFIV
jgi:transposase